MKTRNTGRFFAGLLAAVTCTATAQTTAPNPAVADEEPVRLPVFDISSERANAYRAVDSMSGSRIRQALIDTPATINVVTSDFIKDIGAVSMIDATQYISGVGHGYLSGASGIADRQVIRGFQLSGRSIDNFATIGSFQSNLDPALIERIEIVKGPNAILAPTGNPGGSVNVITKAPQFEASQVAVLELAEELGNRLSVDSTGPLPGTDRFAYRVTSGYQDAHSFVPGKILNKNVNPQVVWAISPTTQLKLKGFLINWEARGAAVSPATLHVGPEVSDGGTASLDSIVPGFGYDESNTKPDWILRDNKVRRATLEFTTSLTDQISMRLAALRHYSHSIVFEEGSSITGSPDQASRYNPMTGRYTPNHTWGLLDDTLDYDEATNPYVSTSSPQVDPSGISIAFQPSLLNDYNNETHYQADFAGNFEIGGAGSDALVTIKTVAGGSHSRATSETRRRTAFGWSGTLVLADPDTMPARPVSADFSPSLELSQHNTKTWAYAYAQLGFLGERLLINGGISRLWLDYFTRNHLGGSTTRLKGDADSPFYAALFKVTPYASVYYSHSTNADGTLFGGDVRFQKGEQDEVGVKLEWFERRLSITASWFDLSQNNYPIINTAPETGFDPDRPQFVFSDFTNEGFELDVVGGLTPSLTVIASYTDMKLRDGYGRQRRNISDEILNGLLKYSFLSGPAKGLNLFAGFNHVGKHPGENPAVDVTPRGIVTQTSFYMPERTIYNVGASYDYRSLRFQLNVDNLTDKKTLWQPNGRFGVSPFPGRNVRFTMTYGF
ncbi:hypothetical protein AXK11_03235 [Cephaloticoccus primus]|uniref:TonB-dependent receptor plug domain-containing protein n=1 Tax=Cephaloticoccus primus TaxID=1548207 RepID=A0A139SQK7_9BACT|nr:TonB-dependent receptor plug domain-containing protein [Cephaloticoccus primus]KXU36823.1 hypothetical protein AXK11_03235 [Cephaloticoccus primus]